MSNIAVKNPVPIPYQAIANAENNFQEIAESKKTTLLFKEEAGFARQLLESNDFLMKTAMKNPQSLKNAIVNLAAIGLTLNKALSYAYLVPRDGVICLDVSYKGLVKLATDTGSIKWAKAELVRTTDNFIYNGVSTVPRHEVLHPFNLNKRGQIIGVYCIAKTRDNDYMIDIMSIDEINEVKDSSKAKNSPYSPWIKFYGEMAKKTIIKRASKSWTKTERAYLDTAIDVINEHEGLDTINYEPVKIEEFQVSKEMQTLFNETFYSENALNMFLFQDTTNQSGEQWSLLKKSFPTDKTINNKKLDNMISNGRAIFADVYDAWITSIHEKDELGQKENEDFGIFQEVGMEMLNNRKIANRE